ncbi:LysR family transcriptional regulator [Amycolatopsis anabasis]|uniref:LysR family transcriptional regulator n=1 Tax=Amycolatopsis anabasis TaxID=1840409 RepID=UPI0015D3CDDF|nr:LysR family transcriptional regulator [Amycolatopsis anabasis]
MDRLETRELAYFVAVAEELHFGRAAERLGIAQPPLSRAIKQLERRLGVELLRRSSRRVELTEAGAVLLHEGTKALDTVAAAARRARRAGQAGRRLVLALKPGIDGDLLPEILAAYESDPDAVPVEVLVCGAGEQVAALRDGRADLALVPGTDRDLTGFDQEELLRERQIAVLPRRHRFAGRAALRLSDLDGEPMPYRPSRTTAATGPDIRDAGQLMQLIALGRVIAVLPESMLDHLRHDLVGVPVLDAEPTAVLIAWPEDSRSRPLAAFVRIATRVSANSHTAGTPNNPATRVISSCGREFGYRDHTVPHGPRAE